MKINVICVGKLKDFRFRELEKEYLRKLRINSVEINELPDGKAVDQNKRLEQEAEKIREAMQGHELCVLLDEKGKAFNSEEFAQWIADRQSQAVKSIAFIIGSSHGVSFALKRFFTHKIQLSAMTMPHELARIVFLEQLYRAFSIISGRPYHH